MSGERQSFYLLQPSFDIRITLESPTIDIILDVFIVQHLLRNTQRHISRYTMYLMCII